MLFISGYARDAVAEEGFPIGGAGFLQKPFGPDELATAVREVLDALSPQASEQD